MTVERYEVGRSYTRRRRTRAALTDPDGVRAVMDPLAAGSSTVQERLADLESRAVAYLKRAQMPLDVRAPIYGDPVWRRENERKSLDWYAFSVLNTIRMLRNKIERGAMWHAIGLALDLGMLASEARMIEYMTNNATRGGVGFKTSDKMLDMPETRAVRRARAADLWAKNPGRPQTHVASIIAKEEARTNGEKRPGVRAIVRAIHDLDPKKQK